MFNFFNKQPTVKPGTIKPVVLVILDGWGIAPANEGNAIALARKPNMDRYYSLYPHGELLAAGESVGLPANEVGNTEVGHINLGAGRVVLQDLKRISKSIEDGSFYYNKALKEACEHVKKNGSKLHIMGLVGSGHVHSSIDHLWASLEFAKKAGVTNVYLHLFTDGRDSPPTEGASILGTVEAKLSEIGVGKIATISGRYWAMDRDGRWDRTQKTYEAMVLGKGEMAENAVAAMNASYGKNQTDEFVEPTVIVAGGKPIATVDDNDAAFFFNYRIDRPRQLSMAFVLPDFETIKSFDIGIDPEKGGRLGGKMQFETTFQRGKVVSNLFFTTMTQYQVNLPVSGTAFPPEVLADCLGEVIAKRGLKQARLAESEKERFVTYYFDCLREERFAGEDVVIVPSSKVPTYDKKPEMSAMGVAGEFVKALSKDAYHFIVLNFANPDMVAHTGNLNAAISAIEHTDKAVGIVVDAVLAANGTVIITADHGNAEELITFPEGSFYFTSAQGTVNTDHSGNPVPVLVISKAFEGSPKNLGKGILADIAPTVLKLMGADQSPLMTGRDLLGT